MARTDCSPADLLVPEEVIATFVLKVKDTDDVDSTIATLARSRCRS